MYLKTSISTVKEQLLLLQKRILCMCLMHFLGSQKTYSMVPQIHCNQAMKQKTTEDKNVRHESPFFPLVISSW